MRKQKYRQRKGRGMYVGAKYIRTERFSNRNFNIEIKLYEHGLASGEFDCKKPGMRARMSKNCEWFIMYSYCVGECAGEYERFLGCFDGDKVARRWVRRVMRHCVGDFLRPDGRIDFDKAYAEQDRRCHRSREYYILGIEQLHLVKRHIPNLFYPGTYRTKIGKYCRSLLRVSSDESYMCESPKLLGHPIGYRKYLQGRAGKQYKYLSLERFKAFLQEFAPKFYGEVCRERTMDDCNMWLEYRFLVGQKPEMRIFVQDKNYDKYGLPYEIL